MKLRDFLLGALMTAMVPATLIPMPAVSLGKGLLLDSRDELKGRSAPEAPVSYAAPPSAVIMKDKVLSSAYYDTLGILSSSGRCSDFFGGWTTSIEAFNTLISRIKKTYLSTGIAMRMSGSLSTVINASTGKTYRVFDTVAINANGPFYKKKLFREDATVPRIGSFLPASREVRVLILLHELGHSLKGEDGKWLLPDDGRNGELSRTNSQKIEEVCGRQIRALPQTSL